MLPLLLASAVPSSYQCPGSAAFIHASCKVEASLSTSCATARAEMLARVGGQYLKWHDPHNNGTYSVLDKSDPSTLALQRVTGNKKYTDKLTFSFEAAANGQCTVYGCSESQVTSVADFSTNYCNLRMMYCSTADGCKPVSHEFAVSETSVSPSFGASKDPSACLKVFSKKPVVEEAKFFTMVKNSV